MSAHQQTQPPQSLQAYLEKIRLRLRGFFDEESVPHSLLGQVDTWSHFVQTDEKYFLSRKMNLYTVNAHRYVGLRTVRCVTVEMLEALFSALKRHAQESGPGENTMSTEYTVALISEEAVDREVVDRLSQLKCQIGFAMGLKGWADIGIIVTDITNQAVYSNPYARAQLETTLWSFTDQPTIAPKSSWVDKLKLIRCGCCTG